MPKLPKTLLSLIIPHAAGLRNRRSEGEKLEVRSQGAVARSFVTSEIVPENL